MWVQAGEGYGVTVDAVVVSAEAIASGRMSRFGAHTAASAFGRANAFGSGVSGPLAGVTGNIG
jgi:hypothetical protein